MSTLVQRSFSAGEVVPALYARADLARYLTALRTARNGQVLRHGGFQSRPGMAFVAEVKDSSKQVRLIPFEFNADQTYMLEFGDQYMRVHRAGAQVLEATVNVSGATQANPCVITTSAVHGLTTGQEVYLSGIGGMTYLNGRNFKVTVLTTTTFSIQTMQGVDINSTSFGAYTSGGTMARVYEISTPYAEADLMALNFVQSGDVITIVHPSYAPRELSRAGHTSWTLAAITFTPAIAAPTGLGNDGAAGTTHEWIVTAIDGETFQESLPSASTGTSAGYPRVLSWTAVAGAHEYNVYRKRNGIYGFIATSGTNSYTDDGTTTPDTEDQAPVAQTVFAGADDYPAAVGYFKQRLCFGGSNNDPEKVLASRIGDFKNFSKNFPLLDDDALSFTLASRKVNRIRHLVDIGRLLILTSGGEWVAGGDTTTPFTPTSINSGQQGARGSAQLIPLIVGETVLFVQARGSIIRDLAFDIQADGYKGNELSIFSSHLVTGYELVDWTYAQNPNSVIWSVRDDGMLLGLTYVREHQVFGWSRCDTDGTFERVCSVAEGADDAVYVVVRRIVDGIGRRYIERFTSRFIPKGATVDVDFVPLDSALSYDGRNDSDSHTMTLSTSGGWTYQDVLTLTSSASFFSAAEVGNSIFLTDEDGIEIRFVIEGYTSATVVTGKAQRDIPTSLQAVPTTDWARAVDTVSGLWHLEGENVAVRADGYVVSSPNNPEYPVLTVENGSITLPRPYAVIHVGLPFTFDAETLDIESADAETLSDKKMLVQEVTCYVENTQGLWAGAQPPSDDSVDMLEGLTPLKLRENESLDDPVALTTDKVSIPIDGSWNSNGRVFLRQVDPVPVTILSIAPSGLFPLRR